MSFPNDDPTIQPQNPGQPVAFCQNCGKSLDADTIRRVGHAVYCEPCLEARLAGAPAGAGPSASSSASASAGYGPVNTGAAGFGAGSIPPLSSSEPNPGLAALLGLIPGVGAMYNEQYGKGIIHLIVFAVLVMFSHITGIFILFIFGWEWYMAIEAHHTARARRDGTPLPNPFGLNDIGDRMGFRTWPGGPDVVSATRDAVHAAAAGFGRTSPPVTPYTAPPPYTPTPGWGAPVDAYTPPSAYAPPSAYTPPAAYAPPPYTPPFTAQPYSPHTGYENVAPPYGAPGAAMPPYLPPQSRFPAGAIWLIGLGTLFLFGTMGVLRAISGTLIVGLVLTALGVWVFIRRMVETGQSLADDGAPGYQLRLLRALRGSVWLVLFGIFAVLNAFHSLNWNYLWPWLLIVIGVLMLLERAAQTHAAAAVASPYGPPPVVPVTSATEVAEDGSQGPPQ